MHNNMFAIFHRTEYNHRFMPVKQEILEQIQHAVVPPLVSRVIIFFFPQQLLVYDEANDATGEPILQWADDMQQAVEDSCFVLTFKTSFVLRFPIEFKILIIFYI